MITDPTRPWWETYNNNVLSARENGWSEDDSRLSRELCDLLDDVAAAFAITGAQTPGWLSPYSGDVQPRKDSYERCTDPEKFLIVVARARAWTKVLVDRGWAREVPPVRWALRPLESGGADTVLEPSSDGAVPLVLTTHTPVDSAHPFNVTIAAGNPAVAMASIPDCACDGCDRGSAVLLEEFDTWVLSVVDGSLEVDVTAACYSIQTSFHGERHGVQYLDEPTAFIAAPWPPNWTARSFASTR
ncbi:hypothetical protein H351_14305 [Rhodococcus erythropolis R138]|uniref:DUF6226 family protein n=1 Tax=Rhodococcus erythropolis TaxID=1833 RepID=UPI00049279B4|nr:DUF6226 family protein [Rhodococcus erythropolis]ALU70308.1 hypothetical protein H351_14305 [Rhodococcus erythropolis R138]